MFLSEVKKCSHWGEASKTFNHLASRCEKILGTDYTRRHNEVLKCIHLLLSNKYVKIRVDTFVKSDIKIKHNRLDLVVIDKRKKEILIIEVGITSAENLHQVETEKLRKYDILATKLTQIHGFTTQIIPYILTWDGVVTNYHEIYRKRLEITDRIEAYIPSLVLKKTLESISLEFRRNGSLEELLGDERTDCLKPTFENSVSRDLTGIF